VSTATLLRRGLAELKLDLTALQQQKLLDYLALLSRWNRAYNLTAVRDEQEMVTRHLLDSLAVLPHLNARRLIDVGSGAGLPGIPLAIALPQCEFSLLDSNGKKTRFLFQAVNTLGLGNCSVHRDRAENFRPLERFDAVLSRAFASLAAMIEACSHLLSEDGVYLAMKGRLADSELESVDPGVELQSVLDLHVPGLDEERCLVQLRPLGNN
jgi:16S rRNA (guanine527-N7)-methyltransferase